MKRRLWIPAAVILVDQVAKLLVRGLTEPVTLIPGVLGLTCVRNTGMAFSMFSGVPWLLGILSIAAVAGGLVLLRRWRLTGLARIGVLLMIGGAASNAFDRLFLGYVIDMLEVLCFQFAVFNPADAALTVGCVLAGLSLFLRPGEWPAFGGDAHGK